jgi:hypothetical protein
LEVREMLEGAGAVLSSAVRERWEGGGSNGGEEKEGKEENLKEIDARKGVDGEETESVEWNGGGSDSDDFTACSEACGYCGKCSS